MFTKHVYSSRSGDENFDSEFTDDERFVNLSPFYQADQIPMDVIKEGVKYIVPNDFNKHQTLEERQEAKDSFALGVLHTFPGIYFFSILHYNDVLECYLCEESSIMLKGAEHVDFILNNLRKRYVSSAITTSPEAVKKAVAKAVNLVKFGPNNYYLGTPAEVISAAAISPYYGSDILLYRLKFQALIPFLDNVPQRVLDASLALCFYEAITNNTCCGVDLLTGFNYKFYNENNTRANPKLVIFNSISQMPSYALSRSLITELISASPEEIQNVAQDDILRAYHHKNVNCIKDLAKIKHLPIPKFPFTWPHEYEWYKD